MLSAVSAPNSPLEGPVAVTLRLRALRPKTTKLAGPRWDVDNGAKSVLDVITKDGRFWTDDSQVHALSVTKAWADAAAVEVAIEALG